MNSELKQRILYTILTASYKAKACHIGSALSCVDILIDLYYNRMKSEDRFIFSKASGVSALYAVLAEKGIIPKNKVAYYLKNYPLASREVPGVQVSVGSLGHGLPFSVGLALSDRSRQVYCLMSDGEIQEGTFWESLLFARHHKLKNLHIIIDRNWYQACGYTEDIIQISDVFWWLNGIFPIEVVYTQKGFPITFMIGDNSWHYRNLTRLELNEAIKQI